MRKSIHLIILSVIVLTMLAFVLTLGGCEVLKTKRTAKLDSTSVTKLDSTRVIKSDAGSKTDSSWYKKTIELLLSKPAGHDTTINHITTPVYNYYPVKYTEEGGTVSKDQWLQLMDSMNKSKADTTSVSKSEETKSKEVKVLGFWQILAIAGGAGFVFFVLGKVKFSFR